MEVGDKALLLRNQVKGFVIKDKNGRYKGKRKTWNNSKKPFEEKLENAAIYNEANILQRLIRNDPRLKDKGLTVQAVLIAEIVN